MGIVKYKIDGYVSKKGKTILLIAKTYPNGYSGYKDAYHLLISINGNEKHCGTFHMQRYGAGQPMNSKSHSFLVDHPKLLESWQTFHTSGGLFAYDIIN